MTDTPPAADTAALRLPPHSSEAERGLLGSILMDASRVMDLCLASGLVPDAFYHPPYRTIYETLLQLSTGHTAIDALTLSERLRTNKNLDAIGGLQALETIIEHTPTSAHAEYYLDIVRQKYLLRVIIRTARNTEASCFEEAESATLILSAAEQAFLDIAKHGDGSGTASWKETITNTFHHIDHLFSLGPGGTSGLPTGLHNLDTITRGLRPAEMTVLAARPSMGKTSLAMNIAEAIAIGKDMANRPFKGDHSRQHAVAVFSLEMSAEALALRMLCGRAGISSYNIESGTANAKSCMGKLTSAAAELQNAPIYVDDTGGLDVLELRARARRLKKRHNIELIVIDYLQLCNCREFARQGRQLETSAISANLKAMAKELNIPVLVLSQLSRAPEQRDKSGKPKLSDLRDSGAIEQDADMVLLLRRPSYYPGDAEFEDKTLAIVDVAKNRNGKTDEVRLNFNREITRFADRADHHENSSHHDG